MLAPALAQQAHAAHVQVHRCAGQGLLHAGAARASASAATRQELNKSGTVIRKSERAPTPAGAPGARGRAQEERRRRTSETKEERRKEHRAAQHLFEREGHRGPARARAQGSRDRHRRTPKSSIVGAQKRQQGAGGGKGVLRQETDAGEAQAGNRATSTSRSRTRPRCSRRRRPKSARSTPSTTRTRSATSS